MQAGEMETALSYLLSSLSYLPTMGRGNEELRLHLLIHSLTHSFNKYIYDVPGIILGKYNGE